MPEVPKFGNWPAAYLAPQAWAIINGTTGAALKSVGGILSNFTHEGTGHVQCTIGAGIAESEDNMCVIVSAQEDGGGAGSTRIASYEVDGEDLNIYTRDAAGALADATRISVAVFSTYRNG